MLFGIGPGASVELADGTWRYVFIRAGDPPGTFWVGEGDTAEAAAGAIPRRAEPDDRFAATAHWSQLEDEDHVAMPLEVRMVSGKPLALAVRGLLG